MKKLSIIIIALMLMTHGFAQEIHLDGVTPTTNTKQIPQQIVIVHLSMFMVGLVCWIGFQVLSL